MHIHDPINDFLSEVAQSADLCLKPWKHSVLHHESHDIFNISLNDFKEIILKIESRDVNGIRHVEKDLELEIFRSGSELNIILSWCSFPLKPILWQGKHSLWMDANSGQRTSTPNEGVELEALARRLRSKFSLLLID